MEKEKKTTKSIIDRLTYAYIRKIKKWMFCPACQNGKMTIDKKSTVWTCEDCGYKLSADEFEDNYVFWFCDECQTYLNNQEGFDCNAVKHICRNCGYENDTTFENVKGICSDCGKIIPDPDATLCADCRQRCREKAKEWLITAGKVVGVAAAVVGAVCVAVAASGDEETNTTGLNVLPPDNEGGVDNIKTANSENTVASTLRREGDIVWYCDGCDAELNRQKGFSTLLGTWTCAKCGYLNDVTDANILSEEEADIQASFQTECPCCGGHMCIGEGYAKTVYVCEDCGKEAWYDDDSGLLVFDA